MASRCRSISLTTSKCAPRQKPECGLTWFFVPARGDLFDTSPSRALGVRGDVGALMWFTATHEFVPATGSNVDTTDYFVADGHHFGMPPGAELPIEQVRAALREYVRTGERPACVEWNAA